MWTLKHDIISLKFYQVVIATELKSDTYMDLKNLYNHITLFLNGVTRLREYPIPAYQYFKRNSEFEE